MSELTKTYRGVTLTYVFDMFVGEVPADEYGAWTFTLNNIKYAYAEEQEAKDKIDELLFVKDEVAQEDVAQKEAELAKEIEDRVEVTEFVVPALPWYAAWLQPVLEFIGRLTKNVVDYFSPIFSAIPRAADYIADVPINLTDRLTESVRNMFENLRGASVSKTQQTVTEVMGEAAPWKVELEKQITDIATPLIQEYLKNLDPTTWEESIIPIDQAPEALDNFKRGLLSGALVNWTIHFLVETGSLGQIEGVRELDTMVISKLGLDALIQKATMLPFEKNLLQQAEYFYNREYPTQIPQASQLIEMVVKEVIPLEAFKEWMKLQGFNEEWSQNIWDAHFIPPTWSQILQAYYRGNVTREQLEELKILVDLDPRYDVIWNSLIEVIPPYQEIVNQRVKEVIDEEEFKKNLQWLGFDEKWADRIWAAHFLPPALGDMLTAWRRGQITEERLDELMIIVDLDPRFKEIFDTRKYDDPSITMGRFMYETGAINEERLTEIVKRQGYLPDDVPRIVDYMVRFQERRWRTRYLMQLQRAFERGIRTEEQLKAAILEANYTEGVADWMIQTSNLRLEMKAEAVQPAKPKALTLGDLKKAFETDRMTEDQFRTALMTRGYPIDEVDLLVILMNDKKVVEEAGGRKVALSQSELLNAYRYKEITRDVLIRDLLLRGLTEDEVNILVNTKEKQWGMTA